MKTFLLDKLDESSDTTAFYEKLSNGMPMFPTSTPKSQWGSTDDGVWQVNNHRAMFYHNQGKVDVVVLDHGFRTYGRIHNILYQNSLKSNQLQISKLLAHEIIPNGVFISVQCNDNSYGIPPLLEATMVKKFHLPSYFTTIVDDIIWVAECLQHINFPCPEFGSFIKHRTRKPRSYEVYLFEKFTVQPSNAAAYYRSEFDNFLENSKSLLNSTDANDIRVYANQRWAQIQKN
jgi:hypothetical protein